MIYLTEGLLLQIESHENMPRLHEAIPLLNQYMPIFHLNETKLRVAHFLAQILHETGGFQVMEEKWNYGRKRLLQVFRKYFNEANVDKYVHSPNAFNKAYARRMGNGSEPSGDGFRYRGRGLIQLTGREDYRKFSTWYRHHFSDSNRMTYTDFIKLLDLIEKSTQGSFFDNELHSFIEWCKHNFYSKIIPVDFVEFPELLGTNMKYAVISGLWEFCIKSNLNKIADADDVKTITYKINGGYNGFAERKLLLNKAKKALGID